MQEELKNHLKFPLTECGIPHAGRSLLLSALDPTKKLVWILSSSLPYAVYPPAWKPYNLNTKFFNTVENVMKESKPIFLEPCFDIVVIDGFRNLRDEDLAFIAIQARRFNFQVILVRDFFLTSKIGNVWAKSRFNIFFQPQKNSFRLQTVRGSFFKKLELRAYV